MGWKSNHGVGQGGFDTVDLGLIQDGQTAYSAWCAFGGSNVNSTLNTGSGVVANESALLVMPFGGFQFCFSSFVLSHMTLRMYSAGGGDTHGAAGTVPGPTHDIQFTIGDDQGSLDSSGNRRFNSNIYFKSYANYGNKNYAGGIYQDVLNEDSIAYGQKLSLGYPIYGWTGQPAGPYGGSLGLMSILFQADQISTATGFAASIPLATNTKTNNSPDNGDGTWANRWCGVTGTMSAASTIGPAQTVMPCAGVLSDIQVNLGASSGTSDTKNRYFKTEIEPSYNSTANPSNPNTSISTSTPYNGQTSLTFPGNAALGCQHGGTGEDSVGFGQLVALQFFCATSGATETTDYQSMGVMFSPQRPNITPMLCGGGPSSPSSGSGDAWQTVGYQGPRVANTNPTEVQDYAAVAGVITDASVMCTTVGTTTALRLTINGATRNIKVPVQSSGGSAAVVGAVYWDCINEDSLPYQADNYPTFPNADGGFAPGTWTLASLCYALSTPDGMGALFF